MDLPDFSKDKQFMQLRKDMGITEEEYELKNLRKMRACYRREYELKKAKLHERHINDLETGTSHSKLREE